MGLEAASEAGRRPAARFGIETVYLSPGADDDELTARVLASFPGAAIVRLAENGDPIDPLSGFYPEEAGDPGLDTRSEAERFSAGKGRLLLGPYRGEWLKSCPGTLQHVCCNLWVLNLGEGCPLDCTYCYLQSYLVRNPTLKIYTNTREMIEAVERRTVESPNRLFRICTGELIDSLVWDDLTGWSEALVPVFARLPNAVLELKTKTTNIGLLLDLRREHNGKTVVSFSVNAPSICASDEAFSASLAERLSAAAELTEAGYRIGFHFDPVVHFPGWEDEYRETVQRIFRHIRPHDIAWVSISTLRYRREMQQVMEQRFSASKLPFGEQFLAVDNKLRYIQPLRFKLTSFLWNELKSFGKDLPVYMCMESAAAWRHIAGGPPAAGVELAEIFSRRGKASR